MTAGLGLLVGLILGLTGAGGAIIAVPLLIFSLNLDVAHSAPIALLAVGASAALGAIIGLRQKIVRYRAAMFMALSGACITPLGLFAARRVPPAPLALLFSAVLLYVAWRMFRQARSQNGVPGARTEDQGDAALAASIRTPCRLNAATGRFSWTTPCMYALGASGLLTGFLSGLLGVGGGFVIVPALRRCSDLPMNAIIATSLMVIALVSSSAVLTAAATGHLNFAIAVPFSLGALAGMGLGRMIAPSIGGYRLQMGFAGVATVVAIGLMVRTVHTIYG